MFLPDYGLYELGPVVLVVFLYNKQNKKKTAEG